MQARKQSRENKFAPFISALRSIGNQDNSERSSEAYGNDDIKLIKLAIQRVKVLEPIKEQVEADPQRLAREKRAYKC